MTPQPQREPRDDQKRDKDVIRRYEIGSDIDGKLVGIHADGNMLSLHEPADPDCKKPKFVFVFRNDEDLRKFGERVFKETRKKCPHCHKPLLSGQLCSMGHDRQEYHAECLDAKRAAGEE